MAFILRQSNDTQNPTLTGGVYGYWISAGRPIYYKYNPATQRTAFVIIIADGGRYGMSDLTLAEYKSVPLTDYKFHRGILTPQIEPVVIDAFDDSSDSVTTETAHGFIDGDLVRFGVSDGTLATPLSTETKYKVNKAEEFYFEILDLDDNPVDLTDIGNGYQIVWKADTGFDDAEQGLPEYAPEIESTLSNVTYVEGLLSVAHSHATNPPDWGDFRFAGNGRRLMDYDDEGTEIGVINGDTEEETDQLTLVPLHVIDNYLVNYKGEHSRIDFESWFEMRTRAEQLIWQRIRTDETSTQNGLIGRYYASIDFDESTLKVARLDANVNFNFGTTSPAPGMPNTNYSIEWLGQIKFEFSELYTIECEHDNTVKIWIDGIELLNETSAGTHDFTFNAEADSVHNIKIHFTQTTSVAYIYLRWSSTSQTEEIVPSVWLFPSDEQVLQYGDIGIAFPNPTEASEVHERLMERIPGYDWTDSNGKIVFLPPNREEEFEFSYDKVDDDSEANFVYKSFSKKRRPISERKNFMIAKLRNASLTGYPDAYVQADRPEIRRLTNGEPSNDNAPELGVCTISMAERMLEQQMVFKTDPVHVLGISGYSASSKLRKNFIGRISYIDTDGNFVENQRVIITFHAWGASNGQNNFTFLQIAESFYTVEDVGEQTEGSRNG